VTKSLLPYSRYGEDILNNRQGTARGEEDFPYGGFDLEL